MNIQEFYDSIDESYEVVYAFYNIKWTKEFVNTKGSFSISKEVLFIVVLFLMI